MTIVASLYPTVLLIIWLATATFAWRERQARFKAEADVRSLSAHIAKMMTEVVSQPNVAKIPAFKAKAAAAGPRAVVRPDQFIVPHIRKHKPEVLDRLQPFLVPVEGERPDGLHRARITLDYLRAHPGCSVQDVEDALDHHIESIKKGGLK